MEQSKIALSQHGEQVLARHANDIRDRLSSALRIVDRIASVPATKAPNQPVAGKDIRAILKLRRGRDRFFGGDLFADPAWDILLELYAAELGQMRISVSSLCLGAAVPSTTALRWIGTLERSGFIERRADPLDGRRVFMSLSGKGLEAMTAYFGTVPDAAPLI